MQLNPVQLSKSTTNSHLLGLLTKRSAKSLSNINSNWPGKFSPSLANIIIKRNNPKAVTAQLSNNNSKSLSKLTKNNTQKLIRTVPLIKMSSATLSLIPSARSKTIAMHTTWRSTKNKFFTNEYLANTKHNSNNELEFRNSRVCEVINNESLEQYKRKSIIELMKNLDDENQHKTKEDKNVLNGYVIDYKTFNYIDKVIDNPEKWEKFVHKKNANRQNHFITSSYPSRNKEN